MPNLPHQTLSNTLYRTILSLWLSKRGKATRCVCFVFWREDPNMRPHRDEAECCLPPPLHQHTTSHTPHHPTTPQGDQQALTQQVLHDALLKAHNCTLPVKCTGPLRNPPPPRATAACRPGKWCKVMFTTIHKHLSCQQSNCSPFNSACMGRHVQPVVEQETRTILHPISALCLPQQQHCLSAVPSNTTQNSHPLS